MVNMALSQLFWDVLMPWNLKSTYFSLKMIHFLSLNLWYVIYVVFWIKYWNLKLPHHCILFLFTICTVSQLFWNRVCICSNNKYCICTCIKITYTVCVCVCVYIYICIYIIGLARYHFFRTDTIWYQKFWVSADADIDPIPGQFLKKSV